MTFFLSCMWSFFDKSFNLKQKILWKKEEILPTILENFFRLKILSINSSKSILSRLINNNTSLRMN